MLTARQQEIWNYLVEYVDGHGYPPTVREIGEHVGLASPSTKEESSARSGYPGCPADRWVEIRANSETRAEQLAQVSTWAWIRRPSAGSSSPSTKADSISSAA